METHGANRFDDETQLRQEVLRRLDEDATYREISKEDFYVSGKKRHVSPAQISRWKKQAEGETSSTIEGTIASAAFRLFEEGASPAQAVIDLKQSPEIISELFDQWAELSGHLVLSAGDWEYINNNTRYRLDQSNVSEVLVRVVEDYRALKGFQYSCSRCGGLIQADPSREWAYVIQKGYMTGWAHGPCLKRENQSPRSPA